MAKLMTSINAFVTFVPLAVAQRKQAGIDGGLQSEAADVVKNRQFLNIAFLNLV